MRFDTDTYQLSSPDGKAFEVFELVDDEVGNSNMFYSLKPGLTFVILRNSTSAVYAYSNVYGINDYYENVCIVNFSFLISGYSTTYSVKIDCNNKTITRLFDKDRTYGYKVGDVWTINDKHLPEWMTPSQTT